MGALHEFLIRKFKKIGETNDYIDAFKTQKYDHLRETTKQLQVFWEEVNLVECLKAKAKGKRILRKKGRSKSVHDMRSFAKDETNFAVAGLFEENEKPVVPESKATPFMLKAIPTINHH